MTARRRYNLKSKVDFCFQNSVKKRDFDNFDDSVNFGQKLKYSADFGQIKIDLNLNIWPKSTEYFYFGPKLTESEYRFGSATIMKKTESRKFPEIPKIRKFSEKTKAENL